MISPERFQKIHDMLRHRQPDLTVVMDNVNKAHNLSAIIRSCEGVGIGEIHAVSYRKSIYTEQNAAAGTSKWITMNLYPDVESAFQKLTTSGMQILVATNNVEYQDFRNIDYTLPTALVVGAEWDGVSEEAIKGADITISIPMLGMGESLNVSVATAVVLFEAQRQRSLKGMYDQPKLKPDALEKMLFELSYPRLSRELREKELPYPLLDGQGRISKRFYPEIIE